MKKKLVLIFLTLLFSSCSSDESEYFYQTINAGTFEIKTPENWGLIKDQGTDTYIGRIKNEDITIFFDQGYLSFGSLESVEKTNATIYFKRLIINGVPAIIHKETWQENQSIGSRLSVYLDNGKEQNRLYVIDPIDEDFIIKIFKTHKFL